MAPKGWNRLLADADWCRGEGNFPIRAYSEFMPPPWLGLKPYGDACPAIRDADDNWGWHVSEYEQAHELEPGLAVIAREILKEVVALGQGRPAPQIGKTNLVNNPYWPARLAERAGKLRHEKYVILTAVALSRTQDDKGRVRWTLFGASEQGPGKAFWKGFYTEPGKEVPAEQGLAFFQQLLAEVYGVLPKGKDPARSRLRILPAGKDERFPFWEEEPIPRWCEPLLWDERGSLRGVHYLLTFRPFERLPETVQRAYLAGELHLLPFPGSLVFWGSPHYRQLQREQPFAMHVPLLHLFPRYNEPHGMQIPQAGWLDVKTQGSDDHDALKRQRYVRTHRFQRLTREQDETTALKGADHVTHVLFSCQPDDLGLYGKPMARNVQVWTHEYQLLLDGPRQGREQISAAAQRVEEGGRFGYRFVFPPMRVGPWELFWHRPIAAYPKPSPESPTLLAGAPTGYLTAYAAGRPDLQRPVELWPRLLQRPLIRESVELFLQTRRPRWYSDTLNVRALLEFKEYLRLDTLPRPLARSLVLAPKDQSLEQWLFGLPERATDPERGRRLAVEVAKLVGNDFDNGPPPTPLTYADTATRAFETAFWKTIVSLAHGRFRTKDNADCFQDEPTREALRKWCRVRTPKRDLDALGDHLISYHNRAISKAGLLGKAWAGEQPFKWETDFEFSFWGGWLKNQNGHALERNIVVCIPGRDRSQAVIMADHYDTAYMYDHYEKKAGGTGARVAAPGADDNHSATAALMLATPYFLEMSKAGQLKCDVWLVHLTGEEFPSDCLGARALAQALVERSLWAREPDGKVHDLSKVRIRGLYVADMIAHNHDRDAYVFQIAPGEGSPSAWLAQQAHHATELWNDWATRGNQTPPRKEAGRSVRQTNPKIVPALARYPQMIGEIRTEWDPRSTLYNTDGQIFSDAGVPAVLLMENYDINRTGYHDTHDTMENIDLDYGSALAAIFIETIARAATADAVPGEGK